MTEKERIADKKAKFLEYMKIVPIQKYAAASIAVDENTVSRWKAEDEEFGDAVEAARAAYLTENLPQIKDKSWPIERMFRESFSPPKQEIEQKVDVQGVVIYRPEKKKKDD